MVCKIEKSHFNFSEMKSLEHIIFERGRTPKVISRSSTERYSRSMTFSRILIEGIYRIYQLQYLTCKSDVSAEERWTERHTKLFEAAKYALTTAPCLLTIDPTKPFKIHTDACEAVQGLESILLQQNSNKQWRAVAYHSNRLTKAERAHSATE